MKKWIIAKNNQAISLRDIPQLNIDDLREEIIKRCIEKARVVAFFGMPKGNTIILYVVMAHDENSKIYVASSLFTKEKSYQSLSQIIPSFHIFERELYEEFGIMPENHPWLKPVRYAYDRHDRTQTMENYPFFKMHGEQVHEVAVGPIHAGVIEPGHFRFMCHGEDVYHLEIQLGYQHRGVEKLFLQKNRANFNMHLAESIAGDTVIGHGMAYASAMETLGNVEISKKAHVIRAIALEMERAAIHIGDLGALANDVAYLMGNAVCGATRTLVINSLLAICGSRFGRGLIRPGGVVFDISKELNAEIKKTLTKVYNDMELMCETMFSSPSVLARFDKTGIVSTETAKSIGLVGPAARASGVSVDIRSDHPYGMYQYNPIHKRVMDSGDVFARAYIRYIEIMQSIDFVIEQLDKFPNEKLDLIPIKKTKSDSLAVSMVEGWRGEIVHCVITGKIGSIDKYKVKDPSFNNWFGLAQSVRDNGISDFPLCNKSFNLSYCGNDL